MFPKGFLGTRADLLFDIVITSLAVVIPVLFYSYKTAKNRQYSRHRNIQVGLTSVLTIVVAVFEWNLQSGGGIFELTRESRFAETAVLPAMVYTHMVFSFSTAFLWLSLTGISLLKFSNPPKPGAFSKSHRLWGQIAMWDMVLTGVTAIALYIVGFAL